MANNNTTTQETKATLIYLNNVNNKLIHDVQPKDPNKKAFKNVSFACDKSINGLATVGVSVNQVKPATRKDNSVIEGYSSVFLGDNPAQERQVSIRVKEGEGDDCFEKITMTVQQIYDSYEANRAEHSAPAEA